MDKIISSHQYQRSPMTHIFALRRLSRALAIAAVIAALPAVATQAATRQSRIEVGAVVLARAVIERETSPASIEVSEADVARGYVEVRSGTRLIVANSSPLGYALDVWPATSVFTSADLTTAGSIATIAQDGGTVMERGAHGPSSLVVLDVRFKLAPGVAPGHYPWPLRYQVRPLTNL